MTTSSTVRDGFDDNPLPDDELTEFLIKNYEFAFAPPPCQNGSFKIDGAKFDVLLTRDSLDVLRPWLYYQYPTVSDKAYLARNCYYFRARTAQDCIDHIMAGGFFCVREYICLIDQSSTDVLNQNFLRIVSIGPLMLQARHLGFASTVLSGFIVLLDILNHFANKFWKVAKDFLILGIKYVFNVFPRAVRLECIGILSSATERFRYSDDGKQRIYRKKLSKFVLDFESTFVSEGWKARPLYDMGMAPHQYCDSLPPQETKTYSINGQRFSVEHEFLKNERNFPCCTVRVAILGTKREVTRTLADRNLPYYVHTFFSTLEEVGLYPVSSCSGSKLTVCNPLH